VDPLAGVDVKPVVRALEKAALILHGADYDLRMLRRDFEFRASEVFDTMSAAQLVGHDRIGLAALVETLCGVKLSKQCQKADWSRRPLPGELLAYATNDTRYLHCLAEKLEAQLRDENRLEWHREVCRELIATVADNNRTPDPERAWRVKGWHTLKSRFAQAILREIWQWRDNEARRADVPAFKILGGENLIALAAWAETETGFDSIPKLPRHIVGRRLRSLQAAIDKGRSLPDNKWPKPLAPPQRERAPDSEKLATRLRKLRDDAAKELNLPPAILVPAASLAAIARTRPQTRDAMKSVGELYDWQVGLLAEAFVRAIREDG
jgi:ribonuclease D